MTRSLPQGSKMRHRDFGLLVCDAAPRDAGLHAVLADPRQGDLSDRPARRRRAPVGASAGQRPLRLSARQRQPALGRPACRKVRSTWAGAAGCIREYDWNGKVRVGAPAGRTASRLPPPAERQHHLPRLGGRAAGDRKARARRACPARCIPTAACMATTSTRSRRTARWCGNGTPAATWRWRNTRSAPASIRDEFAHANAISPLPNGDIYISFRRLNMIALIDRQTRKLKWQHRDDSFGMQHDCEPLAERQRHAVRQRHQHHHQSVLARDRDRPAHAQDRVGISRQADLHVLQPAHQRRAAARRAATR